MKNLIIGIIIGMLIGSAVTVIADAGFTSAEFIWNTVFDGTDAISIIGQ